MKLKAGASGGVGLGILAFSRDLGVGGNMR